MKKYYSLLFVFIFTVPLLPAQNKRVSIPITGKEFTCTLVMENTVFSNAYTLVDFTVSRIKDQREAEAPDSIVYRYKDHYFDTAASSLWGNSFRVEDVNFDGHEDILAIYIPDEEPSPDAYPRRYMHCWIFDTAKNGFRYLERFSMICNPVADAFHKEIVGYQSWEDSCVVNHYSMEQNGPSLKQYISFSPGYLYELDSFILIISENITLCSNEREFHSKDHRNYYLESANQTGYYAEIYILPLFYCESLQLLKNYTFAYGIRYSETEGIAMLTPEACDSLPASSLLSHSKIVPFRKNRLGSFEDDSVYVSRFADQYRKPKIGFKKADAILRKRHPELYQYEEYGEPETEAEKERRKLDKAWHETHLYFYSEELIIRARSRGKLIEKTIHLSVLHGEC